MNINIREHIINNFKNDDVDVLRRAIEFSITLSISSPIKPSLIIKEYNEKMN